jgi:hypothetical protein
MDDDNLEFGVNGYGNTVDEAKNDIRSAYAEIKKVFTEEGKSIPDLVFEFKFDVASFLEHYSKILSLAGLERLTGINQGQLSHYVTGRRKPSQKTVEKISRSLHEFASEISQVQLV